MGSKARNGDKARGDIASADKCHAHNQLLWAGQDGGKRQCGGAPCGEGAFFALSGSCGAEHNDELASGDKQPGDGVSWPGGGTAKMQQTAWPGN